MQSDLYYPRYLGGVDLMAKNADNRGTDKGSSIKRYPQEWVEGGQAKVDIHIWFKI